MHAGKPVANAFMKRLFTIVLPFLGKGKMLKYIFLGLLSGLFSFLFVNAITRVVGLIMAGNFTGVSKEYIIIFACIILLFVWIRRTLSLAVTRLAQTLFWDLRKQIISYVLNANYQQLAAKKVQVHTAILHDVHILMDASLSVIQFSTSSILAVSCFLYLLSISSVLFCITLVVALAGIAIYRFSVIKNVRQFQVSRELENKFQENFNAIVNGFKEIFMEPKKGWYIYDQKINDIASKSYANNMGAFTGFINNQVTGQILFYLLISSVLLLFSVILNIKPADTVSFVFTLLYLLGSLETIMVLLPGIMRAKVAANQLLLLKKELEEARFENPVPEKYISRAEFENIFIKDLRFYYSSENSFGIGPINFSVQKGDVVFIYGGNGSGKTTFIHVVLGLCRQMAGEISLNGIPVNEDSYPRYRTSFAVVFSDFYVFKEILVAENVRKERWDYYVQLFELEGKVTLEGKTLSTTDLSAGQRKRLALAIALLEEKPVLVLDEWAADQDPYFRKKFYTEIIPLLKQEGITIIAITHDDKYYYCADKLFKMDYGRLIEERTDVHQPSLLV